MSVSISPPSYSDVNDAGVYRNSSCIVIDPDHDFAAWTSNRYNGVVNLTLTFKDGTENHWVSLLHLCRPSEEVFIVRTGVWGVFDQPAGWYVIQETLNRSLFHMTLSPHPQLGVEGSTFPLILCTRGGMFEVDADRVWHDRRSGVIASTPEPPKNLVQTCYELSARVKKLEEVVKDHADAVRLLAASTDRVAMRLATEIAELKVVNQRKKGGFFSWGS